MISPNHVHYLTKTDLPDYAGQGAASKHAVLYKNSSWIDTSEAWPRLGEYHFRPN
jgi:hypothetical protein